MGATPFRFQPANEGLTFGTSPQDAAARLSLQHMAGQIAINKQLQAENQLKIQAQQEDQNDQQTIQQEMANATGPDNKVDYDKFHAAVAPKIRLRNLTALDADHQKIQQGAIAMDRDKLLNSKAQNELLGSAYAAVMQAPDEDKDTMYAAQMQRLKNAGVDTSDPNMYPPTRPSDAALQAHAAGVNYIGTILHNADIAQQAEQRKQAAALAAEKTKQDAAKIKADALKAELETAAREHLAVTDQTGHDAWLARHPDIAGMMPKKFDPDTTPDLVQNMALTAEQRAQNADKKQRADADAARAAVAGGKWGLLARAHDPTVSKEARAAAQAAYDEGAKQKEKGLTANQLREQANADRTEMEKNRDRFEGLRDKEIVQWQDVQAYEGAASGKGDTDTIPDPKNATKQITVKEAKNRATAARSRAQELNTAGKEILRQHKWGEFAASSPTPAGAPAVTGKTTTMSLVKAYADKYKMDIGAAKTAIKGQGYTISDER